MNICIRDQFSTICETDRDETDQVYVRCETGQQYVRIRSDHYGKIENLISKYEEEESQIFESMCRVYLENLFGPPGVMFELPVFNSRLFPRLDRISVPKN